MYTIKRGQPLAQTINELNENITELDEKIQSATQGAVTRVDVNGTVISEQNTATLFIQRNGVTIPLVEKAVNIEVPQKVSELTNDADYITAGVSGLINYYSKAETYTREEVQTLINAMTHLSFLIVAELPTTNISTTTIYLVPNGDLAPKPSVYDEYIYINNAWEKIGSTQVDLSNYATFDGTNVFTALNKFESGIACASVINKDQNCYLVQDNGTDIIVHQAGSLRNLKLFGRNYTSAQALQLPPLTRIQASDNIIATEAWVSSQIATFIQKITFSTTNKTYTNNALANYIPIAVYDSTGLQIYVTVTKTANGFVISHNKDLVNAYAVCLKIA